MTRTSIFLAVLFGSTVHLQVRSEGPDDSQSMALLIRMLDRTESPAVQASLLRGMLSGLAGRRNVPAPEIWPEVGDKLMNSEDADVRAMAEQLAQIFGDKEAMRRALETLRDAKVENQQRRSALVSLLTQKNQDVVDELPRLLDQPAMRLDAIRAYGALEVAQAPEILLARYAKFASQHQRAVIETLATRKSYALALLTAIENQTVACDDVPAHVARSLSDLLGEPFRKVYGDVRQLAQDRTALIAKYKSLLTSEAIAAGDASRGRGVFQKTCASCHLLYGVGGKIGPDLTGSNRANLDYILLNSVDPSYDVPDGYRMVVVQTVDGRVLNGVIGEEDNQRVVLKTVDQPEVVIVKEDIEARKVSEKSMMPDGQLEQMKPQQIVDLIKYLRTTQQVEMAE